MSLMDKRPSSLNRMFLKRYNECHCGLDAISTLPTDEKCYYLIFADNYGFYELSGFIRI